MLVILLYLNYITMGFVHRAEGAKYKPLAIWFFTAEPELKQIFAFN